MNWIMGGGAKIVGLLLGTVGFAICGVGFLTLIFERIDLHNAKLEKQGYAICTADFVKAKMDSAAQKSEDEMKRAIEVAKASDEAVGALNEELERIAAENLEWQRASAAAPSVDPGRCLSDGVLGKFGRNRKVEGERTAPGGGKPNS